MTEPSSKGPRDYYMHDGRKCKRCADARLSGNNKIPWHKPSGRRSEANRDRA